MAVKKMHARGEQEHALEAPAHVRDAVRKCARGHHDCHPVSRHQIFRRRKTYHVPCLHRWLQQQAWQRWWTLSTIGRMGALAQILYHSTPHSLWVGISHDGTCSVAALTAKGTRDSRRRPWCACAKRRTTRGASCVGQASARLSAVAFVVAGLGLRRANACKVPVLFAVTASALSLGRRPS